MSGQTEALILVVAALAWVLATHRARRWPSTLEEHPVSPVRHPPITVIRPVKGVDSDLEKNLEAALDHGYPGHVETLFVVDDQNEPALRLVRRAMVTCARTSRDDVVEVVYAGEPPIGRTGKLNAMIAGLARAHGEVIVFADSDTRPGRGALTALVETLLSRFDSASAFAPVVSTATPRTLGDAGYAMLMNGLYGPMAARAAHRNGGTLPFIMGQFMAWRREALQAIGGLEVADGQLVDDMYLGLQASARGMVNLVSPQSVPIVQSGLRLRDFIALYVRWITFSRSGLPAMGFKSEGWMGGAAFWAGLLLAAVGLATGQALLGMAAGVLALAVAGSMEALHLELGGAPLPLRLGWMSLGVLLIAPWVMAKTLGQREVTWRGRRYRLDAAGRLAVLTDEPVPQRVTAHW